MAFWLRAYPRRWREARTAEVGAVLADLAGPGARGLDARAAAGLVRAGWATRWREHPPLGVWLGYRLLDRRIPARYREWARDEIEGGLFAVRRALAIAAPFVALGAAMPGPMRSDSSFLVFYPILLLGVVLALQRKYRDQAVRKHLAVLPGEPVAEGDLFEGIGPRPRLAARSALAATLVVLGVAASAWTAALLVSPHRLGGVPCTGAADDGSPWCTEIVTRAVGDVRPVLVGALAVALGAGLLLARIAARRVRTLAGTCPTQPLRVLVGPSARTAVVVTALSSLVLADAWLEASGRWVILFAVVGGPLALLVLPGAAASLRAVRSLPPGHSLAGADMWSLAIAGRAPRADVPRRDLVRVVGPVPPGAIVYGAPPVSVTPPPAARRGVPASGVAGSGPGTPDGDVWLHRDPS